MALLYLAAIIWLGLHVGLSGTTRRDRAVAAIGERRFSALFSLATVAALIFLIVAYNHAGTRLLWVAPSWLVGLLDLVMLPACVLFAGSLTPRNPTMLGTEGTAPPEPGGIFRITRHPMLCSFGIWAAVHMVATGDTAALVFFGAFLLTVLFGIPSLDAKLARRDPAKWAVLARSTSAVPFAAILAGRTRLAAADLGWLVPLAGLALWIALLLLHPVVIGVPAWPG